MDIKLVATDMDGTFLRHKSKYDNEGNVISYKMDYDLVLFTAVYKKMRDKGIQFIIASGNQYYQLRSFFPNLDDEIIYVAENGAYIVDKGEEIFSIKMNCDTVNKIIEIINLLESVKTCVCGKKSAYILKGDMDHEKFISLFYHRLQLVSSFKEIDDQIFKFALTVPVEQTKRYIGILDHAVGHLLDIVDSGHGSIDLIVPGCNKGTALALLCKRYGFKASQCVAFGDGENDLEMIKFVKYGYAMGNAKKEIKESAYAICESNSEQGVLKTLNKII